MSDKVIYEIVCKRGIRKDECRYKKQDPELNCAVCSYAGYIKRDENYWKQYDVNNTTNDVKDEQ